MALAEQRASRAEVKATSITNARSTWNEMKSQAPTDALKKKEAEVAHSFEEKNMEIQNRPGTKGYADEVERRLAVKKDLDDTYLSD